MGSRLDANSSQVRKRIESHTFEDENGEEYEASSFGGFGDYFRRKKIKLQNVDAELRASSSDKPQIFKGVVAHVSGYTQPSLHVLHREIVQHGGGFLQYLDSKTMATHIIASNLTPKKAVEFSRYRIVKPAWIVDSIAQGKILPWTDYKVLSEGPRQKVLKLESGKALSQATPEKREGYREQTEKSFYMSQFRTPTTGNPSPSTSPFLDTPSRSRSAPDSRHLDDIVDDDDAVDDHSSEVDRKMQRETDKSHAAPQVPDVDGGTSPPDKRTEFSSDMTSEEHNAWLLSDPKIRKSSTANPNFLQQFYSESRLHHLSTWKAELKSKMQRLASEKEPKLRIGKRRPGQRRYILHVDFDSFFCAVSLKKHPEYVDKPAVVAHGSGTGSEIASCNYPARAHGVKNGMWMKRALELCPTIKVLPYDFPAYEEASRQFYEAILDIGGVVQSVSVDEALVDITALVLSAVGSDGSGVSEGSIWREQEEAEKMALALREQIQTSTGCSVSVGIGGNILLAKVALRKAKPAGQFQIKPEDVLEIIGALKVENLPGVAHSIGGKLEEIGIKLVQDLRGVSREKLSSTLGPKTGEKLWEYARGIDRTEVGEQPPRKSVSAEVNWGIRFISQEEAEEFVVNLCKELERRLLNEQVKGKQLTMKIMRRSLDAPLDPAKHLGHGKCDTFNKSVVFGVATFKAEPIGREAVSILRSYKFSPGDLRGLGVQLTKLEPIKAGSIGLDGSQKKLSFAVSAPSTSPKKSAADPIEDFSPQKKHGTPKAGGFNDAIEDDGALTPRRSISAPGQTPRGSAWSGQKGGKTTLLNVSGTQFILPPNADPEVLAELPSDIRSRILAQGNCSARRAETPSDSSRPTSAAQDMLPPEVDPEVFNALPEAMKAEVLAQYGLPRNSRQSPQRANSPLPKRSTPVKGGNIRNMMEQARERQRAGEADVARAGSVTAQTDEGRADTDEVEELDQELLAQLPADVREEVLQEYRRHRLGRRPGPEVAVRVPTDGQTAIHFPAPPAKVTFPGTKLSVLGEIQEMLRAWYSETKEEGPHRRDVESLEKYLARVVLDERDMEKAGKVVKTLDQIVRLDEATGGSKEVWRKLVHSSEQAVQNAVKKRGLGRLRL